MSAALLEQIPLVPTTELGPYRWQDYQRLPDEPRSELIYGRFYVSPSPSLLHQVVVTVLARQLDVIAEASHGVVAVAPLDVGLADHSVVQPDLCYVAANQRGILSERLAGAPSLVVEVLSPGTARRDRGDKLRLYADSGVKEYWILDPIERQIEFLVRRGGEFTVALPSGAEYRSTVLPEIRLDIPAFWAAIEARLPGAW